MYGKELPIEFWTQDSDWNRYLLRRTKLTFDEFREGVYEVRRYINSDDTKDKFKIEVFPNGDYGSNVEIVVVVVINKEFQYDITNDVYDELK